MSLSILDFGVVALFSDKALLTVSGLFIAAAAAACVHSSRQLEAMPEVALGASRFELSAQSVNGKSFLNEALPKNSGEHVLAIGESHQFSSHMKWLNSHVAELIADHNLGAIGIEMNERMNVLLWAYKDQKLPVALSQACDYLVAAFKARGTFSDQENQSEKALLACHAMDNGINVVAHDMRVEPSPSLMTMLKTATHTYFNEQGPQALKVLDKWTRVFHADPHDDSLLEHASGDEGQYLLKARAFQVQEDIQRLLDGNPSYKERLAKIEALRTIHASADASSAALFAATLPHGKNGLTLSGNAHIDGSQLNFLNNVQGLLPLFLASKGLTVTPAVFGPWAEITTFWAQKGAAGGFLRREKNDCAAQINGVFYVTDQDRVLRQDQLPTRDVKIFCSYPELPSTNKAFVRPNAPALKP